MTTNAVLELGAASNQATTFATGVQGGILKIGDASNYSGTDAGLVLGNTIDLANFKFSDNPVITAERALWVQRQM